jgi:predicted HicB family RNase H-like nuclease
MVSKQTAKDVKNNERMIHVRLSPELHRRIRIQAAEKDVTIQDWVRDLIEREIRKAETNKTGGLR